MAMHIDGKDDRHQILSSFTLPLHHVGKNYAPSANSYEDTMYVKKLLRIFFSNGYPPLIVGIYGQLGGEHVCAKFEGAQLGECCRQNCVYNYSERKSVSSSWLQIF